MQDERFRVLVREFVAQFFASESATSDHEVRRAMIGVLAFLLTPALLVPLLLSSAFQFAAMRYATRPPGFPGLLEPMIRVVAVVFVAYSTVSVGIIAALAWDSLAFDRRDAMVLGPLPVKDTTIVAAKLMALATLLLATAGIVGVMTAVPLALVASGFDGVASTARHVAAHVVATAAAAGFVFCVLVTVRALIGAMRRGSAAFGSVVQFAMITMVLAVLVLMPQAVRMEGGHRSHIGVAPTTILDWMPTNIYVGLYETLRGAAWTSFRDDAMPAIEGTVFALAAAVIATIATYRRQFHHAVAPSASAGTGLAASATRAIGRLLVPRDPLGRAAAEFILATICRNRAQQGPIALNCAVPMVIVMASLSSVRGGLAALTRPRTIVLWIPLLFGYWMTIGTRAAFFVPAELPASWVFDANAPATSRSYWRGTRAAMIALIALPAAAIAMAVTTPLLGWRIAAAHTVFVSLLLATLVDLITLTLRHVPFTRPYPPGHAKLKATWPLYLFGMFMVAYWPVRAELRAFGVGELALLGWTTALGVIAHVVSRSFADRWSIGPREAPAPGRDLASLDIGFDAQLKPSRSTPLG